MIPLQIPTPYQVTTAGPQAHRASTSACLDRADRTRPLRTAGPRAAGAERTGHWAESHLLL